MYHFCTIASSDYLPFVSTLARSLRQYAGGVHLHVLLTDERTGEADPQCTFYSIRQLKEEPWYERIAHRYNGKKDELRWALKPVFLSFLLRRVDPVIYLDNDIHFFHPFHFLFDALEGHSLLLTPHWTPFRPYPQTENFKTSFQIGLYNAGFVGATRAGLPSLEWWAECCYFAMEKNRPEGLYDDQRYLDLLPVMDEQAALLRHPGCNLGSWNLHQNRRSKKGSKVVINDQYEVVFIHFNRETIRHIRNGNDALLRPHLDRYAQAFAQSGYNLFAYKPEQELAGLQIVKSKLRLRTRLKLLLFRLSEKL